jgi:hypothetical protein
MICSTSDAFHDKIAGRFDIHPIRSIGKMVIADEARWLKALHEMTDTFLDCDLPFRGASTMTWRLSPRSFPMRPGLFILGHLRVVCHLHR